MICIFSIRDAGISHIKLALGTPISLVGKNNMATLNILLVDDDPLEFQLTDRMLKDVYKGDYVLRYANTLSKAKSILKTQKPDMILIDFDFGRDLIAIGFVGALKAIDSKVPMILISNEICTGYLADKAILDVYDIVDKYDLRQRISNGLVKPNNTVVKFNSAANTRQPDTSHGQICEIISSNDNARLSPADTLLQQIMPLLKEGSSPA